MADRIIEQTTKMLYTLPKEDVLLVHELVYRLVCGWDPDYTKVTSEERLVLDRTDKEMREGQYYSEKDVW